MNLNLETHNITKLNNANKNIEENEDPLDQIFDRGHKRKKYENFNEAQLEILNNWFSKTIYPKNEDFDSLSKEINQPSKKIQNWFKYKRRLTVLDNETKIPQYKAKRVLTPKIFEVLKDSFIKNQNPSLKEFRDLAKLTNLKEKQIISWFTYRRRKLKLTHMQKESSKKYKRINKPIIQNTQDFEFQNQSRPENISNVKQTNDLAGTQFSELTTNPFLYQKLPFNQFPLSSQMNSLNPFYNFGAYNYNKTTYPIQFNNLFFNNSQKYFPYSENNGNFGNIICDPTKYMRLNYFNRALGGNLANCTQVCLNSIMNEGWENATNLKIEIKKE